MDQKVPTPGVKLIAMGIRWAICGTVGLIVIQRAGWFLDRFLESREGNRQVLQPELNDFLRRNKMFLDKLHELQEDGESPFHSIKMSRQEWRQQELMDLLGRNKRFL